MSIYIAEIYTSKWRYVSYIVSAFPVAQLVTSLIMYLNRTYTGIHLWGGISSMVILLFYFLIPESPRWLAQNSKEKDALKVFIYMAKVRIIMGQLIWYCLKQPSLIYKAKPDGLNVDPFSK